MVTLPAHKRDVVLTCSHPHHTCSGIRPVTRAGQCGCGRVRLWVRDDDGPPQAAEGRMGRGWPSRVAVRCDSPPTTVIEHFFFLSISWEWQNQFDSRDIRNRSLSKLVCSYGVTCTQVKPQGEAWGVLLPTTPNLLRLVSGLGRLVLDAWTFLLPNSTVPGATREDYREELGSLRILTVSS